MRLKKIVLILCLFFIVGNIKNIFPYLNDENPLILELNSSKGDVVISEESNMKAREIIEKHLVIVKYYLNFFNDRDRCNYIFWLYV